MTVDEALALCSEIIEMIDDDVPQYAWDKAGEFFEDVRAKVVGVSATIESRRDVTDRQISALEGWKSGVSRWIH